MHDSACLPGRTARNSRSHDHERVHGNGGKKGWGIDLEVVQVAQVFIVDDELRKQLEAEVRNRIKSTSELSAIKMQDEIKFARASSVQRLHRGSLKTE